MSTFAANSEVFKALNKTRGLYLRWRDLGDVGSAETEWTTTELRNSLRSIEWDLEDLEDTINILFQNKTKFTYYFSIYDNISKKNKITFLNRPKYLSSRKI